MRTRRVLAALLGAAGIVVGVLAQTSADGALNLTAVGVMYAAYLVVGLLILHSHPTHLVGRLMLAGGALSGLGNGLLEMGWAHLRHHPDAAWAQLLATVGSAGRGIGWLGVILLLPQVFPDGERTGPRALLRVTWAGAWACLAADAITSLFGPTQSDLRLTTVDNVIGLPRATQPVFDAVSGLMLVAMLVTLVLSVSVLVWRWRHGDALGRQRLLWFPLAFVLPVLVLMLSFWDLGRPWVFAVVSIPLPVAIGVACLQHRLYDLDLVVNRSLTYGGLSVLVAGLYAVTVGGVGALLRQRDAGWLPWVAAGVVAVSFAPLRDVLQGFVNRITYGQWSQPAEVLAATGRRLADATDVPALLQTLVDELGEGLRLSYVEIVDGAGERLAIRGDRAGPAESLVLQAYGSPVGNLFWSGHELRESDRGLLRDVASQLGAVVHSAALLTSLRASQERLVLAREEERRRLRRDLHDGLGPALAGLTLQVDTLRHHLQVGAGDVADHALLELRGGIRATVLDVRRIVEGLRPPAIDELGLGEALRQLVRRLEAPAGPAVEVEVEVEVDDRLPAAVEVAVYRIIAEGVTNAVKHARARHVGATVRVARGSVVVELCDDGAGSAVPTDAGVGLSSMRERCTELGGTLVIDSPPGRGTRIRAELPHAPGSLS